MGYDRDAVQRLYGPGLDAPTRDPLTFNARFNARLGRGPLWVAIRPGALPAPPPPDARPPTPPSFGFRARPLIWPSGRSGRIAHWITSTQTHPPRSPTTH